MVALRCTLRRLSRCPGGIMNRACSILVAILLSSINLALAAESKPPTSGPVGFSPFTDRVKGTLVKFEMIPIPGGKFVFSPDGKETPREIEIKPFWMAKTETTWDQYETWYRQLDLPEKDRKLVKDFDAITRPSPPHGVPDHSWGHEGWPALHTSYNAGVKYCA